MTLVSCVQSIESDHIQRKSGLYLNSVNGELLHGKYKSVTPIGGTYNGNHVSTFEYDEGIPAGEWTYIFNGDPVHSGEYMNEPSIQSEIQSITSSKRIDLNLWQEGGYPIHRISNRRRQE